MTLSKTKLKNSILAITDGSNFPDSINEAIAVWSDAYDDYAKDAVDGTGDSPTLVNKFLFESSLTTAFSSQDPTAAGVNFELAIQNYWVGAQFGILNIPPGSVAKVSSSIVLPPIPNSTIVTTFSSLDQSTTAEDKAEELANKIHAITITGSGLIQHLIPGTPPVPGPPIQFNIS